MDSTLVSSAKQKMDFMTLLVTEMQHQNPLEPMDNQQMASQLAQFTQLELTENMNTNMDAMNGNMKNINQTFEGAMFMANLNYAKSLLGQQVSFYSEEFGREVEGKASKVSFKDNQPVLTVNCSVPRNNGTTTQAEFIVPLEAISAIRQ